MNRLQTFHSAIAQTNIYAQIHINKHLTTSQYQPCINTNKLNNPSTALLLLK